MNAISTTDYQTIPHRFFRLRWRFEFGNGKPAKVGVWDGASDLPQDSAWAVNKTGLARAIIEGEDVSTNEVLQFVVVEGSEYASMQWEAYSKSPSLGFAKSKINSVKLRPYVSGLSILTRDNKATCWVNGQVQLAPLSDHDKLWKIHEHTLG